jgi:hypothetical protein
VLDSLFDGTATAIDARAMGGTILDASIITLDNIGVLNVNTMIAFANGYDMAIPAANTDFVIVGNVGTSGTTGLYTANVQTPPDPLLDLTTLGWYRNNYFGKSRPQYQDLGGGSFISVKDHGAVGDGVCYQISLCFVSKIGVKMLGCSLTKQTSLNSWDELLDSSAPYLCFKYILIFLAAGHR